MRRASLKASKDRVLSFKLTLLLLLLLLLLPPPAAAAAAAAMTRFIVCLCVGSGRAVIAALSATTGRANNRPVSTSARLHLRWHTQQ
jgi:hypothetical protein